MTCSHNCVNHNIITVHVGMKYSYFCLLLSHIFMAPFATTRVCAFPQQQPLETRLISEAGGLTNADVVARKMVDDLEVRLSGVYVHLEVPTFGTGVYILYIRRYVHFV